MSAIKETEHYFQTTGKYAGAGPWIFEISKPPHNSFTDNRTQIRLQDKNDDTYINASVEELESIKEMIEKVIELNK